MAAGPVRRLAAIALVLASLAAAPRADRRVTRPYAGVTYIVRVEASPRPLHMHIVRIDLTTPGLRFALSPPGGAREVVRQSTLEYQRSVRAQAAINGHFFLPFPSSDRDAWVIGLAAAGGVVYSAFETPEQRYAIVADAPALNIDARNHARIVHRDPAHTDGRHVVERVVVWNAVSGSAQIVTDGVATVPEYVDDRHPHGLLEPGGPGNFSNDHSWYDVTTARTAIGLSRDNQTLTLFTVDVRNGSEGMRVGEVAELLLRDYQVWNALNLDGGGSTSMALENPATHQSAIVNSSSDNPAGRSVGSSLAVVARAR
jgi:hypothetical protein